jgi:hypothetical protein
MNSEKRMTNATAKSSDFIYAVYDPDKLEKESTRELAFIEQRFEARGFNTNNDSDERHFTTLKEAKVFVLNNFSYGAEYFSSKQLSDPDNLLYLLADKLTYIMA